MNAQDITKCLATFSTLLDTMKMSLSDLENTLEQPFLKEKVVSIRHNLVEIKDALVTTREFLQQIREENQTLKEQAAACQEAFDKLRRAESELADLKKRVPMESDTEYILKDNGIYYKENKPYCPKCKSTGNGWTRMTVQHAFMVCPVCEFSSFR